MDSANAQTSSQPRSPEEATNKGLMKAVDRFLASSYVPFAGLSVGVDRPVKAMVVRKWESITLQKHYLSTDYVLADHQGGAIHCVARANISHCFTDKLLVGQVYSITNFTVAPPRLAFRIRNADPFVLHLEGNSVVKHLQCSPEGFDKYPLQLVPIPEVVDTGSRYLIGQPFLVSFSASPHPHDPTAESYGTILRNGGVQAVLIHLKDAFLAV